MNQSTGNLVQRGTSIFVMQQDSYMLSQNSWQLIYPYTSKSLLSRSSLVERIYVSWMTWQLDILLIIEEFVFLVLELRIQFYVLGGCGLYSPRFWDWHIVLFAILRIVLIYSLRHVLHKYANEDVSVGSWFIGLDVEHVDDRRLCCGTPPGKFETLLFFCFLAVTLTTTAICLFFGARVLHSWWCDLILQIVSGRLRQATSVPLHLIGDAAGFVVLSRGSWKSTNAAVKTRTPCGVQATENRQLYASWCRKGAQEILVECREARAIPSPAFVVNKYSKYYITVKKLVVYTRDGVVAGDLTAAEQIIHSPQNRRHTRTTRDFDTLFFTWRGDMLLSSPPWPPPSLIKFLVVIIYLFCQIHHAIVHTFVLAAFVRINWYVYLFW